MSKHKGKFIVIESCEAGGKGTVASFLKSVLPADKVILTREPGGTEFAEETRKILLAKRDYKVSTRAELLLMSGARADHLENLVVPALESGVHVISERFRLSTRAYQIHGRQRTDLIPFLDAIEKEVIVAEPDLTIFLDADIESSLARMKKQGRELDRIESEKLDFHKRVYEGYIKELEKLNHVMVNTSGLTSETVEQTIERICKEVLVIVKKFLGI